MVLKMGLPSSCTPGSCWGRCVCVAAVRISRALGTRLENHASRQLNVVALVSRSTPRVQGPDAWVTSEALDAVFPMVMQPPGGEAGGLSAPDCSACLWNECFAAWNVPCSVHPGKRRHGWGDALPHLRGLSMPGLPDPALLWWRPFQGPPSGAWAPRSLASGGRKSPESLLSQTCLRAAQRRPVASTGWSEG